MRKIIRFFLRQLQNIFNPTARFESVLKPENPGAGFGDITAIFGGYGNFSGYVSEEVKDDFLSRITAMMDPKDIPNGMPAIGTVINARRERMRIISGAADKWKMIVQVQVINQNGETWEGTLEDMVPYVQIAAFRPGYTFSVKYDPNDRTNLCIDRNW